MEGWQQEVGEAWAVEGEEVLRVPILCTSLVTDGASSGDVECVMLDVTRICPVQSPRP